MQHTAQLPGKPGKKLKLYYSTGVYNPKFSSLGTILLADKLIKDGDKLDASILDVGCGSGFIGLGLKTLNPFSQIMLTDINAEALRLTRLNAKRLGLAVGVYKANLVPALGLWDIIVANLPTFDAKQMVEEELHGPEDAYNGAGLHLYEELFKQATGRCKALVCEIQPKLRDSFLALAQKWGYIEILSSGDAIAFLTPPLL